VRPGKEWIGFYNANTNDIDYPPSFLLGRNDIFADWILEPNSALDLFDEPTLLRTRVEATPAFEGVGGPFETAQLSIGIIVAGEGELTSPPDPGLQIYKDWTWWSQWIYTGAGGAAPRIDRFTLQDQWDDVKTKRRIESGQGLLLVMKCRAPGVTIGTVTAVNCSGRVLFGH